MSRNLRRLIVALAVLAGVVVLVGAAFGIDRGLHAGEILRNVRTGDVDLSGLDREAADAALQAHDDLLVTTPLRLSVNGSSFELDPASIGFHVERQSAIDAALAAGREGSVLKQFGWWWRHLFSDQVNDLPVSLDEKALETVTEFWDTEYISEPPFAGSIRVEGVTPVPEYPRAGTGVDRVAAADRLLSALAERDRETIALPVVALDPVTTREDIDDAVRVAERMLSGAVVLSRREPAVSVTFTVEDLASALTTEVIRSSDPLLEVGFSPDEVAAFLEPLRAELELPPQDASFEVNDDLTVSVVPGSPGTLIDPELATAALEGAALSTSRQGELPFHEGADPDLTTEEAEALRVRHLLSRFTTYHGCCENRVVNIQLFADIVDGTLILPGDTVSLNELVGERTTERGFLPAGTIIEGEITDTVGGGVSQFATTFYNAVFWGGFEDVTHTPHSYYFSRYPEGVEATISWPEPNLVFRNNHDSAIWIRTSHTDTSITVSFYGDNGGRILIGEQSGGITRITVRAEGDDTAYRVEGSVSDRFNITEPSVRYEPNDQLDPEEEEVVEEGRTGWSVTATRVITYPDGSRDEQTWPVRYRSQAKVIEVHPCKLPPEDPAYVPECPAPTTTTTEPPPETTTTTAT